MPVVRAEALHFAELPGRSSADPLPPGTAAGCSVRLVRIAPGPRTPHVHPYSSEVVYVVDGTGMAWEGAVATAVGVGDVVIIPQGVPHATVASGTSDLVIVCFFPHPDLSANIQELTGPVRT